MMKRLHISIACTFLFYIGLAAQQNLVLQYQYDVAGNRVSRAAVEVQPPMMSLQLMAHGGEVAVTPTVTTDIVTIITTLDPERTAMTYTLSNLQGCVLGQGVIADRQTTLALSQWPSGPYLLTVRSAQKTESFKVVKQ